MFHDLPYTDDPFASWGRAPQGQPVGAQAGNGSDSDYTEVVKIEAAASNVQELQRRIKNAGGVLVTSGDSPNYTVAINNTLRFSVARRSDGSYEIRESQYFWLLIGAAAIVGVLLIAK